MSNAAGPLTDNLLLQNDEYRRLNEEHNVYENRLSVLTAKMVLSDEEQLEESKLKKQKLQVKDRMYSIARQIREGAAHT